MADLLPSLSSISVIYIENCVGQVDHYCKTECETAGKDAPCKMSYHAGGAEDYGLKMAINVCSL